MIDARGRSCPEPVIMIKKAMETNESSYDMMVDNRVSVENVTRYAEHNGYRVEVTENEDDFTLKIIKK
ncbi:MAG: sulfurtransferase TusA family protein [Butyrivibrio sp.]